MAQCLILGSSFSREIYELRHFAENNRISLAKRSAMVAQKIKAIGDDPRYRREIPVKVRICFSIEEHPGGWFRHLSVSIAHAKPPNPEIVRTIMKEIGFLGELSTCQVYMEGGCAVNVIEPIVALTR
jgi:transposase